MMDGAGPIDRIDANLIFKESTDRLFSLIKLMIAELHSRGESVGSVSDTYHTFDELYHHRALLFASLCMSTFKNYAWKSLLHNDPNEPMYKGMFIVGVDTPFGQATYHYDIDPYWALFKDIKEVTRAPKFDGHTPQEAVERIYKFAEEIMKPRIRENKTPSVIDAFYGTHSKDIKDELV